MSATQPKPEITVHPAAAIFPMMSDEELAEMAASIQKHGLREKIHAIASVTDQKTDWQVVDGRNRLEAIRRYLKVPDTDIISQYMVPVNLSSMGATVEEYVLMANIERRNLTQQQRRDLAGKLALMLEEQQKDLPKAERTDTLQEAADKAGVSRRTAATAKSEAKVKAKPPEQQKGKSGASTPPAEKTYVPLKPVNVTTFLANIAKTVSHEREVGAGDEKAMKSELDLWTVEEIRDATAKAKLVHEILSKYLPKRLEAEREQVARKLAALEAGSVSDESDNDVPWDQDDAA